MISPLLDIVFQYGASVVLGLTVGLLSKLFIARQMQSKIHGYQGEIVRSHSRILTLEAENCQLEKKIQTLDQQFATSPSFMN